MSRAFEAALVLSLLQRIAFLATAPSHLTTINACLHPLVAGELMRSGPCTKDSMMTTVQFQERTSQHRCRLLANSSTLPLQVMLAHRLRSSAQLCMMHGTAA
jgi:hypothetical protein